ncbi:MAG: sugar phosphate isomerase/epimerase family protein [Candidatus Cyclobacteriaceae bacterium M3_2C_046]
MNRKQFIKTSLLAAGAVYTAPAWSQKINHQPLIKKSLKYGMIKEDLSVMDKFKLVKELGFDGVELDSPNDLDNKEILAAQDKTGLAIPGVVNSLHWKAPLSDPDPAVRAKCVESMKTALRDCKTYGGSTVLLVPGVVSGDIYYQDAWTRSQAEIRKLLPVAEETGIKIAIENVWNQFLLSPLEAVRYIDEFEHSMIGWYFDVGNIVRFGWPTHWIEALADRILKIDIKEYSRKKQQEEGIWKGFQVELTEGDCDWPAVNKALQNIGYQGWGSAEVPGGDRERLAKISQLMDQIYQA